MNLGESNPPGQGESNEKPQMRQSARLPSRCSPWCRRCVRWRSRTKSWTRITARAINAEM